MLAKLGCTSHHCAAPLLPGSGSSGKQPHQPHRWPFSPSHATPATSVAPPARGAPHLLHCDVAQRLAAMLLLQLLHSVLQQARQANVALGEVGVLWDPPPLALATPAPRVAAAGWRPRGGWAWAGCSLNAGSFRRPPRLGGAIWQGGRLRVCSTWAAPAAALEPLRGRGAKRPPTPPARQESWQPRHPSGWWCSGCAGLRNREGTLDPRATNNQLAHAGPRSASTRHPPAAPRALS